MEYANLGRSGLKVSRIALGCMSYGVEQRAWRLSEADSRPFIRHALDLGINFFDTADMYGGGESEEVSGRALAQFAQRDDIVIATKIFYPMRPGPNGRGLSRKAIFAGIDGSLRRLCTDYARDQRLAAGRCPQALRLPTHRWGRAASRPHILPKLIPQRRHIDAR
jgi:aryl-alcohol dehydrogenase-like predicted oxidoreductase